MIKLSFLGDIMCLKAQNDAVMKKHGEYRYDGYLSGLAPLLKDSNYVIANLESPIMRPLILKIISLNQMYALLLLLRYWMR